MYRGRRRSVSRSVSRMGRLLSLRVDGASGKEWFWARPDASLRSLFYTHPRPVGSRQGVPRILFGFFLYGTD